MPNPDSISKWHREPAQKGKIYRAPFHDYRRPGIYMFTLTLKHGVPGFSTISGTPQAPTLTLSPFGKATEAILLSQPRFYPCEILAYVLMPDHFHLLLRVTSPLERHIGNEMGALEGACKKQLLKLFPSLEPRFKSEKIFDGNKPHDRIVFDNKQLITLKRYIFDNPRRLLIKRLFPNLFHRYNHLVVGDWEMAAYGNIFLLRDFLKHQVRIHRYWSGKELENHRTECLACVESGGVLVSPFIHPWERQIRDEALERNARIICLRIDGFEDRFKPHGREFDLCREGRLLLLAPWPENLNVAMNRRDALALNDMAERIAGLDYKVPVRLK